MITSLASRAKPSLSWRDFPVSCARTSRCAHARRIKSKTGMRFRIIGRDSPSLGLAKTSSYITITLYAREIGYRTVCGWRTGRSFREGGRSNPLLIVHGEKQVVGECDALVKAFFFSFTEQVGRLRKP